MKQCIEGLIVFEPVRSENEAFRLQHRLSLRSEGAWSNVRNGWEAAASSAGVSTEVCGRDGQRMIEGGGVGQTSLATHDGSGAGSSLGGD